MIRDFLEPPRTPCGHHHGQWRL